MGVGEGQRDLLRHTRASESSGNASAAKNPASSVSGPGVGRATPRDRQAKIAL